MVVDFLMLGILGFLLEFLCQKFGYLVLPCAPFSYFTLLIMFMLVTRWNLWSLIMVPLLAFATILGGMFGEANAIAATYDWRAYISIVCGLLMFGVNVAFYRKNTNKIISNSLGMLGLILLDYILFNLMQVSVYRLLTSGSLFERGVKEVVESGTGEVVNVYLYGERGMVYNLFALVIMITGAFVFRSQGVICNVKQKFIDDKRNAEFDKLDKNFSIEEANESFDSEELGNSTNSEDDLISDDAKGDETLAEDEKKS